MQHAGYGVSGTSLQRRPRYSTECTLFTTWSALYYWLIEAKLTIVGQEWRFRKIPRKDVNIQPSLFSVHQVKCPSLLINRNQKPTRCVWHKWRVPGMNIPPLVHVPRFLLWLAFHWMDFHQISNLSLPTLALHTLTVWPKSVNNEVHFTWRTKYLSMYTLASVNVISRNFHACCTHNVSSVTMSQ